MWQGGKSAEGAQEAGLKRKAGASELGSYTLDTVIIGFNPNHHHQKKSKLPEPQFLRWKICLRTICFIVSLYYQLESSLRAKAFIFSISVPTWIFAN